MVEFKQNCFLCPGYSLADMSHYRVIVRKEWGQNQKQSNEAFVQKSNMTGTSFLQGQYAVVMDPMEASNAHPSCTQAPWCWMEYMWYWGLNSGCYTCETCTVPPEPFD